MNLIELNKFNEYLDRLLLEYENESKNFDEMYKKDVEPIINFGKKTYPEIVDELFHLCDLKQFGGSTEVLKELSFDFNGETRYLQLIMGKKALGNQGMRHIYYKHGFPTNYKGKTNNFAKHQKSQEKIEQQLKEAVKRLPDVLKTEKRYYYYDDPTKFLIFYQDYIYIIGIATNENEINYLITTFKPEKGINYLQDLVNDKVITNTNPHLRNHPS